MIQLSSLSKSFGYRVLLDAVTWQIDGKTYRRASLGDVVRWPLTRGPHRIDVVDDQGRRARHDIFVK